VSSGQPALEVMHMHALGNCWLGCLCACIVTSSIASANNIARVQDANALSVVSGYSRWHHLPQLDAKAAQLQFPSNADDVPGQAAALLSLYEATNGDLWQIPSKGPENNSLARKATWDWPGRVNSSYCRCVLPCCCTIEDVHLLSLLSI
jgi:hypothetical protein